MIEKIEIELGGRPLGIDTGAFAKQADGAVRVTVGDTVVLVAATMGSEPREGIDFFPLICDYEERKYAVGKIPGGFVKRGGRPSEKAITTSRLIDRPLRPLFPKGMRNEVQVIAIPLSFDRENPADVLAMVGASAALTISRIPFNGPVGAVRIARRNGEFIVNPSLEQIATSDLKLVVAGTRDAVTTVDADAVDVGEEIILSAIDYAHEQIRCLIELQDELRRRVGQPKAEIEFFETDPALIQAVRDAAGDEIRSAIREPDKVAREEGISLLKAEIVDRMAPDYPEREIELADAVETVAKDAIRNLILEQGTRPDGRRPDEIRAISCEVGMLPRTHGSGLFTRGQTQVLTCLTLGALDDAQMVDTLEEDSFKRYMHFYNFLPFSVPETRPIRGPGRREVGHGALAERALRPMIPSQDEFPYAVLMTSEVLESSGSTSMASVCASTLALMDGGVQIKSPVAGVAMGLMTDGEKFVVLSDIQNMEDFSGDMDFKVAGTANGINALQMDTKISGIPAEVLKVALETAKSARLCILDRMLETISGPRKELSPYAPRVLIIEIHPDKIGDVIGPGGKVIKKIEAETGANIDIEQDGRIYITSVDKEGGERAFKMVDDITRDVKIGETYLGRVTKIMSFGAFVEILPGRDGLVHISQLAPYRVERAEDVVRVGDEVLVKVTDITPEGRVSLTRKGLVQPGEERAVGEPGKPHEPPSPRPREHRREGREHTETGIPRARFRPKR